MNNSQFNFFIQDFQEFELAANSFIQEYKTLPSICEGKFLRLPLNHLIQKIHMESNNSTSNPQNDSVDHSPYDDLSKDELIGLGKRKKWNPINDDTLYEIIIRYNRDWAKVKKRISRLFDLDVDVDLLKRKFKDLKKNKKTSKLRFTKREDQQLLDLIVKYGLNWIRIGKFFPDRCPLALKNRYFYLKRIGFNEK